MKRCLKRCSACKNEKARPHFRVNNCSKDGLTSACKECLRKRDLVRSKRRRGEPVKVETNLAKPYVSNHPTYDDVMKMLDNMFPKDKGKTFKHSEI